MGGYEEDTFCLTGMLSEQMVAWVYRLSGNSSYPFFFCHRGIMQLLRGGQLTAIHRHISAHIMLELVLSVGGGRLELDPAGGFDDVFNQ